jgi:hypothetical protein
MERNHAADEEARGQVRSLSEAVTRIATGPMTSASARLSEAAEGTDADRQQSALVEAAQNEEAAVNRLQALIRDMAQWGDFQGLLAKTRDLLDRQAGLRNETTGLGKSTLGRPVESLTGDQAASLKRLARRQSQLAADVDHLLERMESLLKNASDKDATAADAMDAALRAAESHEAKRHLRNAARAIEANRTAAAVIDQQGAEEAFKKILAALMEREDRELQQLRKYLRSADEQVAQLIEQQQVIRAATEEAGLMATVEEAFEELEQEQRRVKRNTRLLGEDLTQAARTAQAARLVRQAAKPMGNAEARLAEQQASDAVTAQDEALGLLKDAQAQLEEMARRADELALKRSLTKIHDDLEEMLAGQLAINERIEKLKGAIETRGRVGRPEAREASSLSKEQGRVRAMADEMLPELQQVVVYEWALQRVVGWMDASRTRLNERRVDDQLVDLTDRIARELRKLISAIDQTKAMPLTAEFIEAESGGGGGTGQIMQSKPVPTVAELLVLKAMQGDINERSKNLYNAVDLQDATERQLRQFKEIGEDQAEVRRLTEMVTGRVRQP